MASSQAPAADRLRDHFLAWQCRVRQYAMRHAGGRPTSGMRPAVALGSGQPLARVTVLIVHREPEQTVAELRHIVKKTFDPAERYASGLRLLQAHYYQHPGAFSDEMTALFGPAVDVVERLLAARHCVLEFEQYSQRYRIPCAVRRLPGSHPAFQATYWHNSLFNPNIPSGIRVLAFAPEWAGAEADPPI